MWKVVCEATVLFALPSNIKLKISKFAEPVGWKGVAEV